MGGKPSTQRAASLALDGEKNLSSTGGKLVEVGKNICLSREETCKRTVRTHKRSVRFSVRAVRLYVRALRSQDLSQYRQVFVRTSTYFLCPLRQVFAGISTWSLRRTKRSLSKGFCLRPPMSCRMLHLPMQWYVKPCSSSSFLS